MTSEAYLNTQTESINSTDEGPGPKCLERNSSLNTALLFIIYFFNEHFRYFCFLKCHAAYWNFSVVCLTPSMYNYNMYIHTIICRIYVPARFLKTLRPNRPLPSNSFFGQKLSSKYPIRVQPMLFSLFFRFSSPFPSLL